MKTSELRIYAKPHILKFIEAKFLQVDASISIPSSDLILPSILICTTDEPAMRYRHSEHSEESLVITLPSRYANIFIHRDKVNHLGKLLERYFWQQAELFIYRILTDQKRIVFKEDAIKAFYEEYYLTESIYPIGHFRRQMKRLNVAGTRADMPALTNATSYKLTPQQSMQVWRLHTQKKISLRTIARHYGISHETARNISKNISAHQSKSLTNV